MKNNVIEGYDWTENPFRADPITGRDLCIDCWNTKHGTRSEPSCKVYGCKCACYEAIHNRNIERGKKAASTRERHELMTKALESPDNPLRAFNPNPKVSA